MKKAIASIALLAALVGSQAFASAYEVPVPGLLRQAIQEGATGGMSAAASTAVTSETGATVCFPKASWNGTASPEDRPCDTLVGVQEDGSGRLVLGTVGSAAATCTIPNPYEERGAFVVQCRRVPNR